MIASSEATVITTEFHLFELKMIIDIEAEGCYALSKFSLLEFGSQC